MIEGIHLPVEGIVFTEVFFKILMSDRVDLFLAELAGITSGRVAIEMVERRRIISGQFIIGNGVILDVGQPISSEKLLARSLER